MLKKRHIFALNVEIKSNGVKMEFGDEEKRIRKKILSNLSFISIDLGSIERLKLRDDIREVIQEIRDRVDMLKEKLLREENEN